MPAKSKGEAALDDALREVFGPTAVSEELAVKVRGRTLYVDRVIRSLRIAFEVDGRQHSEFVAFHHGDRDGFAASKERDSLKSRWLDANGYTLIRFSHTDKITPELLRRRLNDALKDR